MSLGLSIRTGRHEAILFSFLLCSCQVSDYPEKRTDFCVGRVSDWPQLCFELASSSRFPSLSIGEMWDWMRG